MNDHECLSDLKSELEISEDQKLANLEKIFNDNAKLENDEKKWFRNINFIKWAFLQLYCAFCLQ